MPTWKPPRPAVPGARVGRVEGATTRVEGHGANVRSESVLGFRLVDPQSGVPTEVELRGTSIAGTVRDGDWVEVAGEPGRSGRLEPSRVHNLTTRADVVVAGSDRSPMARMVALLIIVVFVIVAAVIIVGVVQVFGEPGF
ncbi:hypothetical protein SAMN04488543_0068 [Friedmanniella luteola]|uniref:Uncharacterized protein n=1 Tax=Friedmanniella luteola TaxID=546871 RepID=A0A1H1L5L3_9ACTN|nr:hypothetical protein SAMN04488543_0068 [Friedmanniella luteola]